MVDDQRRLWLERAEFERLVGVVVDRVVDDRVGDEPSRAMASGGRMCNFTDGLGVSLHFARPPEGNVNPDDRLPVEVAQGAEIRLTRRRRGGEVIMHGIEEGVAEFQRAEDNVSVQPPAVDLVEGQLDGVWHLERGSGTTRVVGFVGQRHADQDAGDSLNVVHLPENPMHDGAARVGFVGIDDAGEPERVRQVREQEPIPDIERFAHFSEAFAVIGVG